MTLKTKIALVFTALVSTLSAQTQIYRSLQYNKTSAIQVGTGINLTVSGSTATFGSAMPDSIGVGDAIQYDSDNNGSIDKVVFIHARTSSTVYTIKTSTGAAPTATSADDQDWSIFRAYTSFLNWEAATENTGIAAGVRNFDNQRNLVTNDEVWNIACYRSSNDDAAVFITDAWVTDSTHYVKVYAPYSTSEVGTTQRHNGTETQPLFRMNSMVALTDAGTDKVKCFRFEGLVWRMEGTNCANVQISDALANSRIFFDDIVFYGRDGSGCSGTTAGITLGTDFNGRAFVRNCIFYKFDGGGANSGVGRHSAIYYVSSAASTGTVYINNCTDYNSNYFIDHEEPQGFVTVKNSLTQTDDNTTAFFTAGGASFTAASNYNLSDKAADAPGANSKNSTSVTFVSTAANNYHLDSGDTGAGNSGQDLASDYLPVTTDIDRGTRPTGSSTVDIGADEGVLIAAEIDVKGNNTSIVDGDATPSASDSTDFGSVNTSSATRSVTYTILNTGETSLTLSGAPKVAVSGTNAADFTVTTQPTSPVTGGGSTTFVVSFDPSATGTRSATLTITNSDANEGTYDFAIQGTGVAQEMDMTVADGDATPSTSDSTDFGTVSLGQTRSVTYTITNSGSASLTLSGSPKVAIGGTNSSDFTVTTQPSSPVAASGTTTFVVKFTPSSAGVRSATISIDNNDANENPYNFSIQGTGGESGSKRKYFLRRNR